MITTTISSENIRTIDRVIDTARNNVSYANVISERLPIYVEDAVYMNLDHIKIQNDSIVVKLDETPGTKEMPISNWTGLPAGRARTVARRFIEMGCELFAAPIDGSFRLRARMVSRAETVVVKPVSAVPALTPTAFNNRLTEIVRTISEKRKPVAVKSAVKSNKTVTAKSNTPKTVTPKSKVSKREEGLYKLTFDGAMSTAEVRKDRTCRVFKGSSIVRAVDPKCPAAIKALRTKLIKDGTIAFSSDKARHGYLTRDINSESLPMAGSIIAGKLIDASGWKLITSTPAK